MLNAINAINIGINIGEAMKLGQKSSCGGTSQSRVSGQQMLVPWAGAKHMACIMTVRCLVCMFNVAVFV